MMSQGAEDHHSFPAQAVVTARFKNGLYVLEEQKSPAGVGSSRENRLLAIGTRWLGLSPF